MAPFGGKKLQSMQSKENEKNAFFDRRIFSYLKEGLVFILDKSKNGFLALPLGIISGSVLSERKGIDALQNGKMVSIWRERNLQRLKPIRVHARAPKEVFFEITNEKKLIYQSLLQEGEYLLYKRKIGRKRILINEWVGSEWQTVRKSIGNSRAKTIIDNLPQHPQFKYRNVTCYELDRRYLEKQKGAF